MRRYDGEVIAFVVAVAVAACASSAGCQGQSQGAKTAERAALTTAQVLCAWQASTLDVQAIATTCGIVEALTPALRDLVGHKAEAAQAGVLRVAVDGGAPAAALPGDGGCAR